MTGLIFTGCKKNEPDPLVADAGPSQSIQLPINQATLTGSAKSGGTSNMTYLWTIISGPGVPGIVDRNSASTLVSDLAVGTYVFQFQVTNSNGLTAVDTTSVVVQAPILKTVDAQPSNSPDEGHCYSYNPANPLTGDAQISALAWTVGGTLSIQRFYLKFGFGGVTGSNTIVSAKLYLYAMPSPTEGGNGIDAHTGDNACFVQRITSAWTATTTNWNNRPPVTSVNQTVIPKSVSTSEDAVIDVTEMVKDMISDGNYGFAIQLQNENFYRSRQYASSFNANAALHPKLVINYY